jgi:DNA polymerase-1
MDVAGDNQKRNAEKELNIMNLLVDADILLFRFSFSHERKITWEEGVESTITEPERAFERIETMVNEMLATCHCEEPIMCFTDYKNYRYDVYPEYKANRKYEKMELPRIIRKWMEENYEWKRKPFLEADDVMGVMATKWPKRYVIATIDKDLLQIPGRHYNWMHKRKCVVSESEGDRLFYKQCLTGDRVDNYFGVPGIGPAKADKILDDNPMDEWWDAIVEAYELKQLSEEYALQMARVARICRVEDYDFEKEEPILWTPSSE